MPGRLTRERAVGLLVGVVSGVLVMRLSDSFAIGFAVGVPAHVVLHELGHLLAAAALGLRPQAIRLFGRTLRLGPGTHPSLVGHTNAVAVRPDPEKDRLAARMVAFALAGPAANAGTAAALLALTTPGKATALAGAAASAGFLVAYNLVPHRAAVGQLTDGLLALGWLRQPERAQEQLRLHREWNAWQDDALGLAMSGESAVRLARRAAVQPNGRREIAAVAAVEDVFNAAAAGDLGPLGRQTTRLAKVAADPYVDPAVGAYIAGSLAYLHALQTSAAQLAGHGPADLGTLARLAALAWERDPDNDLGALVLGMSLGLQDCYDEARTLLAAPSEHSGCRAERAAALALVEYSEQNLDAAERLAELAMVDAPGSGHVRVAHSFLARMRTLHAAA